MSVQVFIAPNAREGLARVREALGDDAVVLSTRPHPRGVELLASAYGELAVTATAESDGTAAGGSRILQELARLRGMLQNQLAGFAWGAARRRDPARVALMQTLFAAGFGSALTRTLAARLPRRLDADAAQRWLRQVLIRNLPLLPRATDLLARGRYALVGSTGSGKTTTLAKLAARGVDMHGAGRVALVAADVYRIGATAQLQVYADLLGVSLHVAEDADKLARLLPLLADRALVLIDTAGHAPNDPRTRDARALDTLGVRRLAVVCANQQGAAIEQAMQRFGAGAAACILTKLDETPQPGAALDGLIRHRLPLSWISSGQRVPEDLYRPNAAYLVDRALRGGQLATPYTLEAEDWPLVAGIEAERAERRHGHDG